MRVLLAGLVGIACCAPRADAQRAYDLREPTNRTAQASKVLAAFAATETPLFLGEFPKTDYPESNSIPWVCVSKSESDIMNEYLTFRWGWMTPNGLDVFHSTLVRYYLPAGSVVPSIVGMGCVVADNENVVELRIGDGRQYYMLTSTGIALIRLEDGAGHLRPICFGEESFRIGDLKYVYRVDGQDVLPVGYVLQHAGSLETLSWLCGDFTGRSLCGPSYKPPEHLLARQKQVAAVIADARVQARFAGLATNRNPWVREAASNLILRARSPGTKWWNVGE